MGKPDDAFDLLDLLALLMADPDCRFYPRHPAFIYKRIGRTSRVQDGYPTFLPDTDVSVPLSRLVGHSSELNLSIGVSIPGTITLPEVMMTSATGGLVRAAIGLHAQYQTHIFRNYALIANALPQVTQLPIYSPNDATFQALADLALIANLHSSHDQTWYLDLTRLPVCNRQRGREACDWAKLADLALESLKLSSMAKVLRAKRDELDPKREGEQAVELTPEQAAFLEACGVRRDGSFSPPTVQDAATDVLDIRTFEVKVKNGSPVSMKDFALMVEGKKKVNYVGELMMLGHHICLANAGRFSQKGRFLSALTEEIGRLEAQKRAIDTDLNARRFAVALTGAWARSWNKDEVIVKASDGHEVTLRFEIKQKVI